MRLRSPGLERDAACRSGFSPVLGTRLPVIAQLNDGFEPGESEPPESVLHRSKACGSPLRLRVFDLGSEIEIEQPVVDSRRTLCGAHEGPRPSVVARNEMFDEFGIVGVVVKPVTNHQLHGER